MGKNIFFIIGIFVIVLLNAFAFSQKTSSQKSSFNINSANQAFAAVQAKLKIRTGYRDLVFSVQQLEELQTGAQKCVDESDAHLQLVNQLLKSTQIEHGVPFQHADFQYLQSKKIFYLKQLSECRLFVYRSKEAIVDYKNTIQKISANFILKHSEPIWKIDFNNWPDSLKEINYSKMREVSGVDDLTQSHLTVGSILLLLTMIMALYVRSFILRFLATIENTHSVGCALLIVVSQFIFPGALFSFSSVYLDLLNSNVFPVPTIVEISHAALILTLSMAATRFLFYPSKSLPGLFALPIDLGKLFYYRILILLLLLFFGYVFVMLFREQVFSPSSLIDFVCTSYITLICIVTAWGFLLWHQSHYANQSPSHRATFVFFSAIFVITLTAIVVTECLGYHRLTIFAIMGLCLTIVYTVIFVALWRLTDVIFQWIDNVRYMTARKVRALFGVKFNKTMYEVVLIKFSIQFVLLCIYVIIILRSWSIASNFVDSIEAGLFSGFKFSGITIIPLRLILALLSFSIIFLMGRFIATSVARKHRFRGEEDTQIAISTIIIYVSFTIAVLFSLLTTGIDFTGLAIVAGALSVGVGLGLQNIVNNFVSGLILLIEKPIKPGDRVVIGKTEGFVRKIRIRSTQIATLTKEDVIVPNADFITQQVTNCMFRDRNSRVSCRVGVAYGSDLSIVKKLLLEVAEKHNEVISEAPNEPIVLFTQFGDNSLLFDLLCVIHDVNKKYTVMSDLNFAIDAIFRQHKIEIAFPQMDVHVKKTVIDQ